MGIDRLNEIFREVFDDDSISVFPEMTARDIPDWDSFNHINLVLAIEEGFDVQFTSAEISGLANVGEFVDVLKAKNCDISF